MARFPILGWSGTTSPSTSATNYHAPADANGGWSATESSRQTPVSEACTVPKLWVKVTTAPGEGKKYVFTVRKNGADTGATVTIEGSATEGTFEGAAPSFAAGDLVTVAATPTGTPSEIGSVTTAIYFETTGDVFFVMGGSTSAVETGATNYIGPFDVSFETAEATARSVVPMACTLTKLYVSLDGTPGAAGKNYTFSGRLNGETDFLSAKVESATATSATGSQAVTAGDLLVLKCAPSGTPTARRPHYCFSCVPAVSGQSYIGYAFNAAENNSAATYTPALGRIAWNTTEGSQFLPPELRLGAIYVAITVAPGSGKSRTYKPRSNKADLGPSVKIEGEAKTGSYTGSSVTTTAGTTLTMGTTPAGTPATDTGGSRFGIVILSGTVTTEVPLGAGAGQSAATLGVAAPTRVPLGAGVAQAAGTLGLTAVPKLALGGAVAQSAATLGKISFEAKVGLQPANAEAGPEGEPLLLSEELLLGPGVLLGSANTFLRLFAPTQLALQESAGQSSATLGAIEVEVALPLAPAAAQSAASLGTVITTAQILPSPSTGQSAATISVRAATTPPLGSAAATSSAALSLSATTGVGLNSSAGVSDADLSLTGTGSLILQPGEALSDAALGVGAETFLPALPSTATSEAAFLLNVPAPLDLNAAAAQSEATLGVATNLQFGLLQADAVSTATLSGSVFRGMELIDEGRDGHLDGGLRGNVHRGRIGDPEWAI